MGFKNHIRHGGRRWQHTAKDIPGSSSSLSASLSQNSCSHNTLQQQSPDVQRSNPLCVLKTAEANLPNETCPTSLPPLQPAQCPREMWEIFMPHPVQFLLTNILYLRSLNPLK